MDKKQPLSLTSSTTISSKPSTRTATTGRVKKTLTLREKRRIAQRKKNEKAQASEEEEEVEEQASESEGSDDESSEELLVSRKKLEKMFTNSPSQIAELVNAFKSVKAHEFIIVMDGALFREVLEDFVFEGFNPAYYYAWWLFFLHKNSIGIQDGMMHILIMAAYSLNVGHNISVKARKRVGRRARKKIESMISMYGLKQRATGQKEFSIGRFQAAVPQAWAQVLLVKPGLVTGAVDQAKIPEFLCFPSGISLIPRVGKVGTLLEGWLKWQRNFSDTIKRAGEEPQPHERLSKFANMAWSSSHIPDEARWEFLKACYKELPGGTAMAQAHGLDFSSARDFVNPDLKSLGPGGVPVAPKTEAVVV